MAISKIAIETFFSALNSWETSICESSQWYASYIEFQEGDDLALDQ